MNVSRDEAAQALDEIGKARGRIVRLKGYHHGAPYFIVWGLIWLIANTVTQFWREQAGLVWPIGIGVGFLTSTAIGILQTRNVKPSASSIDGRIGWRIGVTSLIYGAFIFCLVYIAQPETGRQGNAMISIFFPFLYMAAGIWSGWRLFAIGLVTAVAIMAGFFWVKDYFDLWMGVFGGGSLIAGGLWLRTA
jgi:hypothetical protein